MSNESSFDGTMKQAVHFAPTVSTGEALEQGMPIFYDGKTNEPIGFDPIKLMNDGRIGSKTLAVFAQKRHGKTGTNMMLADALSIRRVGPHRTKISIDDHRRNQGRGEYDKLCRWFKVEEIPLRNYQLNLLDPVFEFSFAELLELLQSVVEFTIRRPFTIAEAEAIRVALWIVYHDFYNEMEIALVAEVARQMNTSDLERVQDTYLSKLNRRMGGNKKYQERKSGRSYRQTSNVLEAAADVASILENFILGRFGQALGGNHSLAAAMQEDLFVADYAGLSDDVVMIMQMWFWKIKKAAIVNQDQRFHFNMEIHDENWKLWRYLPYAEAMSDALKQIRETDTFIIISAHRLADFRSVGTAGSRESFLADNMLDDFDMFLFGKQSRRGARELAERFGLKKKEEAMLRNFKTGQWLLKIGTEEPIFVSTQPDDGQKILIASDAANDAAAA